ncbi:MAG: PcfB family protein [Clostridia bacterium]|nr:PcfB family protein [Clostridia bacterium]
MLQEELQHKMATYCITLTKLTGKTFWRALKAAGRQIKKHHANAKELKGEELSVKELTGKGLPLSSMEMDVTKGFEKHAKKYGVKYAPIKNEDGTFQVFFQAKDDVVIQRAFADFTAKRIEHENREPLNERLSRAKAKAKAIAEKRDKDKTINLDLKKGAAAR